MAAATGLDQQVSAGQRSFPVASAPLGAPRQGKVNPVIPEAVNQAAFRVVGNDTTITLAAEAGQLQLNAFGPVTIATLLDSVGLLTAASAVLARRCVGGIAPNLKTLGTHVQSSLGVVTALSPYIGYDLASEVAAEAAATGSRITDVAVTCSH